MGRKNRNARPSVNRAYPLAQTSSQEMFHYDLSKGECLTKTRRGNRTSDYDVWVGVGKNTNSTIRPFAFSVSFDQKLKDNLGQFAKIIRINNGLGERIYLVKADEIEGYKVTDASSGGRAQIKITMTPEDVAKYEEYLGPHMLEFDIYNNAFFFVKSKERS